MAKRRVPMKFGARAKNAAHKALMAMKKAGKRVVKVYVKEGKGGKKPHYRNIAITAALLGAAAAGAYYIKKHKKHGHVLYKKNGK